MLDGTVCRMCRMVFVFVLLAFPVVSAVVLRSVLIDTRESCRFFPAGRRVEVHQSMDGTIAESKDRIEYLSHC